MQSDRAKVTVVGLGKLGLPMAALFSSVGHDVFGVDHDRLLVEDIEEGRILLEEPGVADLFAQRPFEVGTTGPGGYPAAAFDTDATFVIVPTPSDPAGRFVNDYVLDVVGHVVRSTGPGHLLVVCSTVMPGSCDRAIRPILEEFDPSMRLVYSPEFIALGSVIDDMRHPAMVLIGADNPADHTAARQIIEPVWQNQPSVRGMSLINAEIAKIALNTYVTMKISYGNDLGAMCERVGADAHVVAQAIGDDPRVGPAYLQPGAQYGGPCFPRDTDAFQAWARDLRTDAPLAAATDQINRRQAQRIAEMVIRQPLRPDAVDRRVAVLGLAYKAGTPVTDRSAGIELCEYLVGLGFEVVAHDPLADNPKLPGVLWCGNAEQAVAEAQVAVVTTPHELYASRRFPCPVIDCWRIVPDDHAPIVHRIGVGT